MSDQNKQIDRIEAALRAESIQTENVVDKQTAKIDAWIAQNSERFAALRQDSNKLAREMVAQIIQRDDIIRETAERISDRLEQNSELRQKVIDRIQENQERLLTYDRKARIFQTFGIRFGVTEETIRHHV